MTEEELNEWAEDFEAFQARFAPIFGRKKPRQQAKKYVRGLLASVERKNSWQLAEAVGDTIPDPTQRLLYHSRWEVDAARDELEQYVMKSSGKKKALAWWMKPASSKKGRTRSGLSGNIAGPPARSRIVKWASF